jgi:hypothetical protein
MYLWINPQCFVFGFIHNLQLKKNRPMVFAISIYVYILDINRTILIHKKYIGERNGTYKNSDMSG